MIESPPKEPSLQDAAEWMIRALRDEGFPILFCGRSALDYQGEYTGSVDIDLLIGTDYRGALHVLDAYMERGDLDLAGAHPQGVNRYLVSGLKPVDVMDATAVHPELFRLLRERASTAIDLGTAGKVLVVNREGYFVLGVIIGIRGFSRDKEDPMAKVREGWELFGERTDRERVERMLRELESEITFAEALGQPSV